MTFIEGVRSPLTSSFDNYDARVEEGLKKKVDDRKDTKEKQKLLNKVKEVGRTVRAVALTASTYVVRKISLINIKLKPDQEDYLKNVQKKWADQKQTLPVNESLVSGVEDDIDEYECDIKTPTKEQATEILEKQALTRAVDNLRLRGEGVLTTNETVQQVMQALKEKYGEENFDYIQSFIISSDSVDVGLRESVEMKEINELKKLEAKMIAVPVNIKKRGRGQVDHIVTFMINRENQTLEYYDSKGKPLSARERNQIFGAETDVRLTQIADQLMKKYDLKYLVQNESYHQKDAHSCGVFVSAFVRHRLRGIPAKVLFKGRMKMDTNKERGKLIHTLITAHRKRAEVRNEPEKK